MPPSIQDLIEKQADVIEALDRTITKIEKTAHDRMDKLETLFRRSPRGADAPDDDTIDKSERWLAQEKHFRSGDLTDLKALSVGIEADGGYVVEPEMEAAIYRRTRESTPVRAAARNITISSDAWEQIRGPDAVVSEWVGEMQSRGETGQPSLASVRIPTREMHAQSKVTSKLLDDSRVSISDYLAEVVGDSFAELENAAFTVGNGENKPRGFLDYAAAATTQDDSARAWGVLQYTPSGGASGFDGTDPGDTLIDMQSRLKPTFRARASWMMNRATSRLVRQFKDGQGNYLWQTSFQAGQPERLLGHPVILNEDMPDVGANTFPLALADWTRAYYVITRTGTRVLRDPYTDKPLILFDFTRRVGGDLFDSDALKLLKCATT